MTHLAAVRLLAPTHLPAPPGHDGLRRAEEGELVRLDPDHAEALVRRGLAAPPDEADEEPRT